jgi:hypothetical protein
LHFHSLSRASGRRSRRWRPDSVLARTPASRWYLPRSTVQDDACPCLPGLRGCPRMATARLRPALSVVAISWSASSGPFVITLGLSSSARPGSAKATSPAPLRRGCARADHASSTCSRPRRPRPSRSERHSRPHSHSRSSGQKASLAFVGPSSSACFLHDKPAWSDARPHSTVCASTEVGCRSAPNAAVLARLPRRRRIRRPALGCITGPLDCRFGANMMEAAAATQRATSDVWSVIARRRGGTRQESRGRAAHRRRWSGFRKRDRRSRSLPTLPGWPCRAAAGCKARHRSLPAPQSR